jgi:predicted nucleic acid-binding protein
VDTSVWIDHLRKVDKHLVQLLEKDQVLCHPFVIGELDCGNLENRSEILSALKERVLPGRMRNRFFSAGRFPKATIKLA